MSEQRIGKIVQVIGPVVDVEFEAGNLPNIMNALLISNPAISDVADNLVVEVAQHLSTMSVSVLRWIRPMAWYVAWKCAIRDQR